MKCKQCKEDIGLQSLADLIIEIDDLVFCSVICADDYFIKAESCPICNRKALVTLRSGGWTVDCYYHDAWHCVSDTKFYCSYEGTNLFNTKKQAIEEWNRECGHITEGKQR